MCAIPLYPGQSNHNHMLLKGYSCKYVGGNFVSSFDEKEFVLVAEQAVKVFGKWNVLSQTGEKTSIIYPSFSSTSVFLLISLSTYPFSLAISVSLYHPTSLTFPPYPKTNKKEKKDYLMAACYLNYLNLLLPHSPYHNIPANF